MSDTWRVLLILDNTPEKAVLVDLPADIAQIDAWTRMQGAIGSHVIDIEVRRIT